MGHPESSARQDLDPVGERPNGSREFHYWGKLSNQSRGAISPHDYPEDRRSTSREHRDRGFVPESQQKATQFRMRGQDDILQTVEAEPWPGRALPFRVNPLMRTIAGLLRRTILGFNPWV